MSSAGDRFRTLASLVTGMPDRPLETSATLRGSSSALPPAEEAQLRHELAGLRRELQLLAWRVDRLLAGRSRSIPGHPGA